MTMADREERSWFCACLAAGGLTLVGLSLALAVIIGLSASLLGSCEIDIGTPTPLGDPGNGRDSQRLGVVVSPAEDLVHGQEVVVASDAFEPKKVIGVAVCLREADTDLVGVDACDSIQGALYATDGDGLLEATYAVPRTISVGGATHDCAGEPGRCLLVAADASDYDQSGGQPLAFRADVGPAPNPPTRRPSSDQLPIGAAPGGPVAAGTELTVIAEGFQPCEPLLVAWCTAEFTQRGPVVCEAVDETAAVSALLARTVPDGPLATAEGTAVVTIEARATISPAASTSDSMDGTDDHDCRSEPGTCAIVVAVAADTKRSAVLPYELLGR